MRQHAVRGIVPMAADSSVSGSRLDRGIAGVGNWLSVIALLMGLCPVRSMADDGPAAATAKAAEPVAAVVDPSKLEDGVVTGVLVKADGSPVAGATVILHTGGSNKTTSDAQGRFRLEKIAPRAWAYPLWAHQGNLVTQIAEVRPIKTADPAIARFAPLRLEMTEGRQAHFVVTSEITKQPIAGAAIRFGYPDRRLVTTDDRGEATVSGLMPASPFGGVYDVTIEAEGHARQAPILKLSATESVTNVHAALVAGGIVQGTVRDVDGKPVPEVLIIYRIGNETGFYGDAFRSDAEGKFRHRFLPLDTPIAVSTELKGYLPQKQTVTLTAKQPQSEIQFSLPTKPKGGSVSGVVADGAGKPVAGARISNERNNAEGPNQVTSDADGRFVIHDVAPGPLDYELGVSAKGFAPQIVTVEPGTAENPAKVSIKLKPGHMIRGRVLLENGQPAKGAVISTRSASYTLSNYVSSMITVDETGAFQADSLPDDASFDVQLRGYPDLQSVPIKLDSPEPITVTLAAPGVIRGRVVDADTNQPITQFRTRLAFASDRRPGDPQGTWNADWGKPGITFESATGEFVIQPLVNQMPVDLTVERDGYQRTVIARAIAWKAADAPELVIALSRPDPKKLATLTGRLIDFSGQPLANAQLRLMVSTDKPTGMSDGRFNWSLIKNGQLEQRSYCDQFQKGVTTADGRFEFTNLLPGKHLQLAYWGDNMPHGKSLNFTITAAGKGEDVTIQLPQPAMIRGTINRAGVAGAGLVYLAASSATGGFSTELILADDQTTFEFKDLLPGSYTLGITTKRMRLPVNGRTTYQSKILARRQLKLAPGELVDVDFSQLDPAQE